METNHLATASPSSVKPSLSDRMQHSKALVAIVAVLGVTVAALAAALVVKTSDAEPNPYEANTTVQTPANKLAATSSKPVSNG